MYTFKYVISINLSFKKLHFAQNVVNGRFPIITKLQTNAETRVGHVGRICKGHCFLNSRLEGKVNLPREMDLGLEFDGKLVRETGGEQLEDKQCGNQTSQVIVHSCT